MGIRPGSSLVFLYSGFYNPGTKNILIGTILSLKTLLQESLCEPYNLVLYPFFTKKQRISGIIYEFFEQKAFIFWEDVVSLYNMSI